MCRMRIIGSLLLAMGVFLVPLPAGASPLTDLPPKKPDPIALGKEFGVIVGPLTVDVRKEISLKLTDGVVVYEIIGNSPAERAGLKPRVVITEINNQRVRTLEDFGRLLAEVLPAGNFTVGTWEPTNPENQGAGQQVNFYFVSNRVD